MTTPLPHPGIRRVRHEFKPESVWIPEGAFPDGDFVYPAGRAVFYFVEWCRWECSCRWVSEWRCISVPEDVAEHLADVELYAARSEGGGR